MDWRSSDCECLWAQPVRADRFLDDSFDIAELSDKVINRIGDDDDRAGAPQLIVLGELHGRRLLAFLFDFDENDDAANDGEAVGRSGLAEMNDVRAGKDLARVEPVGVDAPSVEPLGDGRRQCGLGDGERRRLLGEEVAGKITVFGHLI